VTGTESGLEHVLAELTAKRVPGISAAVVGPGERLATASAGVADIASGAPATPDTVYLWFSMTKIVTATAVMQLAERGALGLGDAVQEHLPEFPRARGHGNRVEIRHLLSHSSGLANPIPVRWVHPAGEPGRETAQFTRELLAKHDRLRAAPGRRASYSNLGYIALGEVIRAASGRSYEDYVREEILGPLGMTRTGFRYDHLPAGDVATGYQPRRSPMTPLFRAILPDGIMGGREGAFVRLNPFLVDGPAYGGLVGTVADAARFLAAHLNGGEHAGARILTPESVAAMREIHARGRRIDVGYGWFRRGAERRDARFWEHLGGGGGFWNMMRVFPERGVGVLSMGNSTRYDHRAVATAATSREMPDGPKV